MCGEEDAIPVDFSAGRGEVAEAYLSKGRYWGEQAQGLIDPGLIRLVRYRQGSTLRSATHCGAEAGWEVSQVESIRQEAIGALREAFDGEPDGTWLQGNVATQLGFTLLEDGDVDGAREVSGFASTTPYGGGFMGTLPTHGPWSAYDALQRAIARTDVALS